jgi:hypothetical protein
MNTLYPVYEERNVIVAHDESIQTAKEYEKLASDWRINAAMGVNKFKSLTKAKAAALKAMDIYRKCGDEINAESIECKIDLWEPDLKKAELEENEVKSFYNGTMKLN